MLSIGIPTYNYSIVHLVAELHEQATKESIDFEIIIMDDASSNSGLNIKNQEGVKDFNSVNYYTSEVNSGREITRQKIAEKAKYDWLLFLDADIIPKENNFIHQFISALNNESDVIFGGISYKEEQPNKNSIFRWKYGSKKEQISVENRIKNPYLTINSGCFLIQKNYFTAINKKLIWRIYGLDILFTFNLKKNKTVVKHIYNPVYHLGLETNKDFLEKSKKAIETLVFLENKQLISSNYSHLQRTYMKLGVLKNIFYCLTLFKSIITKNLLSNNPSLFLFDIYRLHYYIKLKNKKSA